MATLSISPKQGHLERLLELAAGIGFDNTPADPREEALIHTLLSICTRRSPSDGRMNPVDALGGGDISLPLLHLTSTTTGVAQSLALQALKTWSEDHPDCMQTCIRAGAIPLLLAVFSACLPTAAADVAAAYSASLAVIHLRAMVREGGDEGASAFLQANGVAILNSLLIQLALDPRSLCLVLYLLNDVTRRSSEVLDAAINARLVDQVVSVLRQPISEATKFAALILNRWSLSAQHLDTIRSAGPTDVLLRVLEEAATMASTPDSETVAYAISAFAIMTQDSVEGIRSRLLATPLSLLALTKGLVHYERCFQGVGFPHALMSIMLDGPEGAPLVAALASRGLLPVWLKARHVGVQLTERAAQGDALRAMTGLCDPEESVEVSIALTHLLERQPCVEFLGALASDDSGRLEHLTLAALSELIYQHPSPSSMHSDDDDEDAYTTLATVAAVEGAVDMMDADVAAPGSPVAHGHGHRHAGQGEENAHQHHQQQQEEEAAAAAVTAATAALSPPPQPMSPATNDSGMNAWDRYHHQNQQQQRQHRRQQRQHHHQQQRCVPIVEDPRPQLSWSSMHIQSEQRGNPAGILRKHSSSSSCCTTTTAVPVATANTTTTNNSENSNEKQCTAALTRLVSTSSRCLTNQNMLSTEGSSTEVAAIATEEPVPKRQRLQGPSSTSTSTSTLARTLFKKEDVGVQRYDTLCFVVGGQEVHAVGFVLEAHSSFLRGLLSTVNDVNERVFVPALSGFDPGLMHSLFVHAVEWCYTGEVAGLGAGGVTTAFNVWALAEFLQMDGLQRYCEEAIESWFTAADVEVGVGVVLQSLALADAYVAAEPLRSRVARHILSLIVDPERRDEAESVVGAVASAGHASSVGASVAAEVRSRVKRAAVFAVSSPA